MSMTAKKKVIKLLNQLLHHGWGCLVITIENNQVTGIKHSNSSRRFTAPRITGKPARGSRQ